MEFGDVVMKRRAVRRFEEGDVAVPCVSAEIYHRRYREADKVAEDGSEIEWPVPYWFVDVGATMMVVMLAAVDAGLASFLRARF